MRPTLRRIYFVIATLLTIAGATVIADDRGSANRETSLAPDPRVVREAVVQVYGARAMGVKGYFGVHTWIAVKPTDATVWTVYEVIGWRLRWAESAVVVRTREPDSWFGAEAELYADKRGAGVDELINRIDKAARDYPFAKQYTLWPGPNSNTFVAWIGRAVPELEIDLPATAIGKDYLGSAMIAAAPSGRGFQFSLAGLLGLAASGVDGVELNILGLNFGLSSSGIKLPLVGRVGPGRSYAQPAPVTAELAVPPVDAR